MNERRQNLRVRPAADYDIRVDYVDGPVTVRVQVTDVAIGGMGLVVDELFASKGVGSDLPIFVSLPGYPRFETVGVLRHTTGRPGGPCGVQLSRLTDEQAQALQRAVAELQERGLSA